MFKAADNISLGLFLLMVMIYVLGYLYWAFKIKLPKKWIVAYLFLIMIFSFSAISGLTTRFAIPIVPLLMFSLLTFSFVFVFSKSGKQFALLTPFYGLIALQAFRFPLELILHQWAQVGTIPETMTWSGQNFDILAGVICLIFAPVVYYKPKVVWIPQIVGFLLLLNVLRVVIMSSPFPFSWKLDIPLQLIMYFPYVVILPVFVLPAFLGHLIIFRKLIENYSAQLNSPKKMGVF